MNRAVALLAIGIVGLVAGKASAGCCRHCGCECQCCKVCVCVPDVKKVPKTTYSCECEDFCVPGHSKICGYKCPCEDDCCGCKLLQHFHREPIFQPTCAKVKTRTKLVKNVEMKEVCGWKWEVRDLCPRCSACAQKTMPTDAAHAENTKSSAEQAAEYYAGSDEIKPVADTASSTPSDDQKAELASHSTASKLKKLLPMFK